MRNSNRNILIIILCLFFVSGCFLFLSKRNTAQISSPDISEDKRLPGGYRSTWDCVFFGEYPRSEVSQSEAFDKAEWTDDEALIDGKRYKRVKTKTGCRYFIYEPLKWRIIEKNDNQAVLLADQIIDSAPLENRKRSRDLLLFYTDVSIEDTLKIHVNSCFKSHPYET